MEKFLSTLMFLYSVVLLIATTFKMITVVETLGLVDFVYFSALLTSTILSYRWTKYCSSEELDIYKDKRGLLGLTIVFIFIAVCIFQSYSLRTIWLDEYTQYLYAFSKQSPMSGAATEQQFPSDYILTYLSTVVFGTNPLAIKIVPIIFSLLFVVVVYLFSFSISKSVLISIATVLFSFINLVFTYYTIEARPVMHSSFLAICLYFLLLKSISSERIYKYSIFIVSLLLSFSIGLQPPILLISIALVLLLMYKKSKETFKVALYSFVVVGIIYLPLFLYIKNRAEDLNKFNPNISENFFRVTRYLPSGLYEYLLSSYGEYTFWAWSIVVFISISVGIFKRRISNSLFFSFLFLISTSLLFVIFNTFVNWSLTPKYLSTLYIIPTIIFFSVLVESQGIIKNINKKMNISWVYSGSLVIMISMFTAQVSYIFKNEMNMYNQIDLKNYYRGLEELENENSRLVVVKANFISMGAWKGDLWVAPEFYLHDESKIYKKLSYLKNNHDEYTLYVDFDDPFFQGDKKEVKVVFSTFHTVFDLGLIEFPSRYNFKILPVTDIQNDYSFTLNKENPEKDYLDLLEHLISNIPHSYSAILHETLLHYAYVKNNKKQFVSHFERFKNLKFANSDNERGVPQYFNQNELHNAKLSFYQKFLDNL